MSNENIRPASFLVARDPSIDRRFRPVPVRKVRLFDDIKEELMSSDNTISTTYDTEDNSEIGTLSMNTIGSNVSDNSDTTSIYLRLRPVYETSSSYKLSDCGKVLMTVLPIDTATNASKNTMEKHFSFSDIFESHVNQKDIFGKCIANQIATEENFSVLAYGTSGSGKSYTLLGNCEQPGILPRALEMIFTMYVNNIYHEAILKIENSTLKVLSDIETANEMRISECILKSYNDLRAEHTQMQSIIRANHNFETLELYEVSVLIWVSFVEIYNENVYDLLAPPYTKVQNIVNNSQRKKCRIVNNDGNVYIQKLTSIYVRSGIDALKIMQFGLDRLTFGSTHVNTRSSRSHCIFFVDIIKYSTNGTVDKTSYKFCDLAGSERINKTGISGVRLNEAKRINTSLMILGRCLDAATRQRNTDIIPFRESKLTMLLQSALIGKEKLAMFVNVTPTDKFFEENLNVLNFSAIAKSIVYKPPVTKEPHTRFSIICLPKEKDKYIEQLLKEIGSLKEDLKELKEKFKVEKEHELLKREEEIRKEAVASMQAMLANNKEYWEKRLENEISSLKRSFENTLASEKRKHEEELEDLREMYEDENPAKRTNCL